MYCVLTKTYVNGQCPPGITLFKTLKEAKEKYARSEESTFSFAYFLCNVDTGTIHKSDTEYGKANERRLELVRNRIAENGEEYYIPKEIPCYSE